MFVFQPLIAFVTNLDLLYETTKSSGMNVIFQHMQF
jgi:hypothetical protein